MNGILGYRESHLACSQRELLEPEEATSGNKSLKATIRFRGLGDLFVLNITTPIHRVELNNTVLGDRKSEW